MNLTEDLQRFVDHQIAFGIYETIDDVLIAAVTLLRDQHLAELKADLDEGLRQLENGECIHLPDEKSRREFFEQLKTGKKVSVSCPEE